MYEIHAIYNYIGNKYAERFDDNLVEASYHIDNDFWYIQCFMDQVYDSVERLEIGPQKAASKFYCTDSRDVEKVIKVALDCCTTESFVPNPDLEYQIVELNDDEFLEIYNDHIKERDLDLEGKYWTPSGWVLK